jgi:hypothetical protein
LAKPSSFQPVTQLGSPSIFGGAKCCQNVKKKKKKGEYFVTGFQNFPRKSPNLEKKITMFGL